MTHRVEHEKRDEGEGSSHKNGDFLAESGRGEFEELEEGEIEGSAIDEDFDDDDNNDYAREDRSLVVAEAEPCTYF